MNKKIKINVISLGEFQVEKGISLLEISKLVFNKDYKKYLGARINNEIFNLYKEINLRQMTIYLFPH